VKRFVLGRFIIALGLAVASAPGQAPQQPAATPIGGINLTNASLLEVINTFARELKINYVLDASVKGGTVTINTFGAVNSNDLRPLLETILRMNNLVMVQAGNIYRIVPAAGVGRQPISPTTEVDPAKIPEDERMVLNLVFLRYVTSSELVKILQPFAGEGAQLTSYDPGNLLIILDNSRNMRRTLELVKMFDSDTFAGQRVRAFDVKNSRPSLLVKELDQVFKAYSLGTSKDRGTVQFLPMDRISTILAIAPNPGAFAEVEKWMDKLDIPAKVTAGSVENHVYKLKYGRAEILGVVIMQLYGGGYGYGGGFGGGFGGASYGQTPTGFPAINFVGGGGAASPFGGGYTPYGAGASPYGNPYGGAQYGSGYPGGYQQAQPNPLGIFGAQPGGTGIANAGATPNATPNPTDQTGTFLNGTTTQFGFAPRIIPNPFDNTLLVQGSPEQWEQIQHLLSEIDVAPRQVLIDAKIYEVDLTGDLSAGVESFLQKRGATNSAGITDQQVTGAAGAAGLVLTGGTLVGHSRELLSLLTASDVQTKAKVLSAPSIIATDSIAASITVGSSVPTLTSQAVNAGVTTGGNSLFTNTIANTTTGVGLNILARVNASGVVTMVINQNVSAPQPTTSSTINSPSFSQRNISTQITVEDGDTVAIGGIIDETNTESSSGVPFLSRIPYLGFMFGTKTYNKTRTELIIFLTPHVIIDRNQMADATEELKEKVKGLKKEMTR
jgi:general secretion pathway protein D